MTTPSINTSRSVDALLFDLGGVVIDIDFGRAFACWADYAGEDADRLAKLFSMDEAYAQHERGEILYTEYFESLRKIFNIAITDDQFSEGWNSIYVGEIRGMADLLAKAILDFDLYAFTNSNHLHQSVWAERFCSLLQPFERVFSSAEMGMRKPEERAFNYISEQIGIPVGRIAFFDDLTENVAGAKIAGLQAFQVLSLEDTNTALADLSTFSLNTTSGPKKSGLHHLARAVFPYSF